MLKYCSPCLRLCAPLLLVCLALVGCKQDEGDRCQLNSDCSDGLICCFSVNPPPLEQRYLGGTCTTKDQCSTTQADLGEILDNGIDASTEGMSDDGGDEDSTVDAADTDTSGAADSTVDTTPPADSTVDTTPPADSSVDSTDDIQ